MCRFNLAVDDVLMEEVKPHLSKDVAVQKWLEEMLHKALLSYAEQFASESRNRGRNIVEQLKALENDPEGFFKLGTILKPSKYSAKELRDEYISEKYGI